MKFILSLITLIIISYSILYSQEQYELMSIKFEGNKEISAGTLSDIIFSEETPMWLWKFLNSFTSFGAPPQYFDSSNIERDLSAMEAYYNANGFFEARFKYAYEVDTTEKEVRLTYTIDEKDPSHYHIFTLYGLDSIPEGLKKNMEVIVQEDTTERYVQDDIQENVLEANTVLLNNGYMLGRFDSTVIKTDTIQNNSDLDVFFTAGNRYKVDTVIVDVKGEGAPYVKEDLLRKLTDVKKNEYFSAEKIRMSQVRLFRTDMFTSINIQAAERDTFGTQVPILLQGTIGRMNELSPEIIVNNQQSALNIGLGASYTRKNFLGEARKLTLKSSFGVQDIFNVDFGNIVKRFSFRDTTLLGYFDTRATIEQPYLFSKPIFGTWENYLTINKQKKYNNTVYGSKITFDFELPQFTFVNRLRSFYNVEVSNEVDRTRRDSLSTKLVSVIGADIGKTTTDNIMFPTRGYNISVQFEEANSLPWAVSKVINEKFNGSLFYKLLFNSSFYFSVDRQRTYIFATKFKTGHLQAYVGDYRGIPINRSFYAGGSNSVRGWRSNELIPEETPFVESIVGENQNIKGGTFLLEGSMEFRAKFIETIGAVAFFDYGNTWIGYKSFRYQDLAIAGGFGLRYYTTVAPFRVDFGFKLYDPADKKWITKKAFWKNMEFHFGIGEAF